MLDELDGLDGNHGLRDKRSRDAILGKKSGEPERHGINNLVHEDTWDATIYSDQLCVHLPNPLLHGPVEAFNIWNVIVSDRCIQLNIHVRERCSCWFEFLV